jgi:hypothetical protein
MHEDTWQQIREHLPSMANILACDWGKLVSLDKEEPPCPEQAVRRVGIHAGTAMAVMQFCEPHAALIERETNPHKEGVPADGGGKQGG